MPTVKFFVDKELFKEYNYQHLHSSPESCHLNCPSIVSNNSAKNLSYIVYNMAVMLPPIPCHPLLFWSSSDPC